MSELSSSLGASAPKHILKMKAAEYPVSLITQNVKVAFEKALYAKAREALADIRDITDHDYYNSRMDALVEKYGEGFFSMESEYGRKAMGTLRGSTLLLSLLLNVSEMTIFQIVAEDPVAVGSMLKTVLQESFPGVNIDKLIEEVSPASELPKASVPTPAPMG